MRAIAVISTKGGVGKTTVTANLGGFIADAGMRVLLLNLDAQSTLSSYYGITHRAAGGIYELLAFNEKSLPQLISNTVIQQLDIVLSNDAHQQLGTLLLHAADGRLRLRNLLPIFEPHYDLLLIDTQGARSVLLEMAVLAAHVAVSPITPEILAARELQRGTLQLINAIAPYRHFGIELPSLHLLINRVPAVSSSAKLIQQTLRLIFRDHSDVHILRTEVPATEAFPRAATQGLPAHRVEYRRPRGRQAPAALETIRDLAVELCPQWQTPFNAVTGRTHRGK